MRIVRRSRGREFASETRNLIWIFLIKYEQKSMKKFHFSEAAAFTLERKIAVLPRRGFIFISFSWKNRNSNYFEMKFSFLSLSSIPHYEEGKGKI